MGYVKTPEEIRQIEHELANAGWSGEWLSIQFLTDADTHRRLLPPPLAPAEEPLATVTVGRWRSSCLGDFAGGVLSLAAKHEDVEGGYVLAIYMDTEPPVVFGRELFGEPKKMATSEFATHGDSAHAWIERNGVRLFDLQATLGTDLGPAQMERSTFNYKARTAADGRGLQEDAILTRTRFATELHTRRLGTGQLVLTSAAHDPVGEVEILEVRSAVHATDHAVPRSTPVATVPAAEFLPYHYGRQDDWLALAAEPSV